MFVYSSRDLRALQGWPSECTGFMDMTQRLRVFHLVGALSIYLIERCQGFEGACAPRAEAYGALTIELEWVYKNSN